MRLFVQHGVLKRVFKIAMRRADVVPDSATVFVAAGARSDCFAFPSLAVAREAYRRYAGRDAADDAGA